MLCWHFKESQFSLTPGFHSPSAKTFICPTDLAKSRGRDIHGSCCTIAMEFDRRVDSTAAEMSVNFWSNMVMSISRLRGVSLSREPFNNRDWRLLKCELILIPACISNFMSSIVWDKISYPSGCTVEVLEWMRILIPHPIMFEITYSC